MRSRSEVAWSLFVCAGWMASGIVGGLLAEKYLAQYAGKGIGVAACPVAIVLWWAIFIWFPTRKNRPNG